MSKQTWREAVAFASGDGPTLANSAVATSIMPVTARKTFEANFLNQVGRVLKVTAAGRVSNIVTTPGTLTLDLRFGAIVVANGGAMALNVVAKTNVPWYLEWLLVVRAIGNGTNANLMHQGKWMSESVVGSPVPGTGGPGSALLPNAAPAVGSGFDSTASQAVDFFGTWSIGDPGNSITCHQFLLEVVN